MVVGVSCSKHQQTYIDKKLGLTNKLYRELREWLDGWRDRGGKQILGLKSL